MIISDRPRVFLSEKYGSAGREARAEEKSRFPLSGVGQHCYDTGRVLVRTVLCGEGDCVSKNRQTAIDFGLLVMRLTLGMTFIVHGLGKILKEGNNFSFNLANYDFGMPKFVEALTKANIPIPELTKWLAFAAELGGGMLLIIGFLPRVAALAIAGVMIIAILKVHRQTFLLPSGAEYCLNLLAMSIMILCAGGGRFGLGGMIRQQREKRKKSGGKPPG